MNGVDEDFLKSFEYHDKACNLNLKESCYSLGYYYSTGSDVPQDNKKALAYYVKACDLNVEDGCNYAIIMINNDEELKKDSVKLNSLYEKGCMAGDPYKCLKIIMYWIVGDFN